MSNPPRDLSPIRFALTLVGGLVATNLCVGGVAQASASAEASPSVSERPIPLAKMFPYLAALLRAPASERSRFRLVYYLERDGRPAPNVTGRIQDGTIGISIRTDGRGRIEPVPTLDQLQRKGTIVLDLPASANIRSDPELEPVVRPSATMDAPELAAAIDQASTAIRKFAGVFSFAAPRIKRVVFVGSLSGEALTTDGRTIRLPQTEDGPAYEPERLRGVATIRFLAAPRQLMLTQ